jgi:hypothetical protein
MATVYVFGAGASKAVAPSAPLNNDLLSKALELVEQPVAARMEPVREFIAGFYPTHADQLPPLEDVLSQLDLAINEGRPLSSRYTVAKLRDLRESVIYGLAEVLRINLEGSHPSETDASNLLGSFLGKLHRDDTLVSLNYDIILDNRLLELGLGSVNYGVNVRNTANLGGQDWSWIPYGNFGSQAPLYKPHGSLNWLYCPLCRKLDVTAGIKGARYIFIDERLCCQECQGRFEALIITPTMFKTYNNVLLTEIWRQVEDRLSRANEIVFVGYSLPDADVQLRCVFARALFLNRNRTNSTSSKPVLRVLEWDKTPPETYYAGKANDTHVRYQRLFGDVDFDPTGFVAYMRRGFRTYHQAQA